jgi:hypothetical protein
MARVRAMSRLIPDAGTPGRRIGEVCPNEAPKQRSMVSDPQVHQLVDDHLIATLG